MSALYSIPEQPTSPPLGPMRHTVSLVTPAARLNQADREADGLLGLLRSAPTPDAVLVERATSQARRSLALNPDYCVPYYLMACLYQALGWEDHTVYVALTHLRHQASPHSMAVWDFVEQYRAGRPYCLPAALVDELCETSLLLFMDGDLRYLDLFEYNPGAPAPLCLHFLGRVTEPRLMCSTRDWDILPTHKRACLEDLVKLGKDRRVVVHNGTAVALKTRAVFGPAIDTVYYNSVLSRCVYPCEEAMARVQTVLEIGVGAGFLIASVGRALSRRPVRLVGCDVSATALEQARYTLDLAERQTRWTHQVELVRDGDYMQRVPDRSVQLLFTNPPYIPEVARYDANPVSGTEVLEDVLLRQGPRVLTEDGILLILYSSLSERPVQRMLAETPLITEPLGMPLRVPLDLREVTGDPHWVHHLLDQHGLEEDLTHPSYPFWHTLTMRACYLPTHPIYQDKGRIFGCDS
jgi:SAM-dependent methyltransferase